MHRWKIYLKNRVEPICIEVSGNSAEAHDAYMEALQKEALVFQISAYDSAGLGLSVLISEIQAIVTEEVEDAH